MKIESENSRGYMVRLDDMVQQLQTIRERFGNTCVYVRGSISWGGVAMNRRDEDEKLDAAKPEGQGEGTT